ncbi:MAG: lytic transglycosylase domain-containing protein, partial [Halobacteriovoraceae bacterium]|nr:lytic transglycosylase domain-containing protein [Halobacteriovoraceae bacterium]
SLKDLRKISNQYGTNLLISDEEFGQKHLKLSKKAFEALSLFHIFNEVNSNLLTGIQARQIRNIPAEQFFNNIPTEDSKAYKAYFLIRFFSENQHHLSSFKVAYMAFKKNTIKLNPLVVSSLFPREYTGILKKHNKRIDDSVVLSLIRQESAFNKKARSIVGARGLMQIMPATGREFKRRLKSWQLYNPDLNIKIGTKYLANLIDRYEGNLVFSLASYNAGMGNVGKWLKTIPFSTDMVANIEMIPFKETRKYVKLIYRNIFFYKYMDGNQDFIDTPINDSFIAKL